VQSLLSSWYTSVMGDEDNNANSKKVIPFPDLKREGTLLSRQLKAAKLRFVHKFDRSTPDKHSKTWSQFRAVMEQLKKKKS